MPKKTYVTPYDIIIPVHNRHDCLKECLDSLFAKTNYPNFHVLIINDCSNDIETNKYIDTLKSNPKITVLENQANLGFIASVNKGMRLTNNNVILLNSDVILTRNWLSKMHELAYAKPSVATVTPLTNNAVICSVPEWLAENQFQSTIPLDEYAELIERISFRRYPFIPFGYAFCLLLKREVLNKVGYFNEKDYEKGYYDDNDFSIRVMKSGYRHLLDDSTFVLHRGHMSFGDGLLRADIATKNYNTLIKTYPEYEEFYNRYISSDPLGSVINNIQLHTAYLNGKKNIVYIVDDNRAQVKDQAFHDAIKEIREDFNLFLLTKRNKRLFLEQCIFNNRQRFEFGINNDKTFVEILGVLIESLHINAVHFHTSLSKMGGSFAGYDGVHITRGGIGEYKDFYNSLTADINTKGRTSVNLSMLLKDISNGGVDPGKLLYSVIKKRSRKPSVLKRVRARVNNVAAAVRRKFTFLISNNPL